MPDCIEDFLQVEYDHLYGLVLVNFHGGEFSDSLKLIDTEVFFTEAEFLRYDNLVTVEVDE